MDELKTITIRLNSDEAIALADLVELKAGDPNYEYVQEGFLHVVAAIDNTFGFEQEEEEDEDAE